MYFQTKQNKMIYYGHILKDNIFRMSSLPNLILQNQCNLNHNTGVFFYINWPPGFKIYMELQKPKNSQNNIAKMNKSVLHKTGIDLQAQRMKFLWLRGLREGWDEGLVRNCGTDMYTL